jgi:hypothetical protein
VRAIGLLLLASCSTARPLAPLRQGQVALEGSLPSVWFESDPPLRIPSPTIGARVGVSEKVEVRATFHPVHLFLEHRKILGLGGGGIFHVSPADGFIPALHFTSDLTLFVPLEGGGGPKAIAVGNLAVLAHWEPVSWLFPYLVFDAGAASNQNTAITSILAGLQVWPHGFMEVSFELGWFAFSVDRDAITSSLIGSGHGLFYVGTAIAFRLGKRWP